MRYLAMISIGLTACVATPSSTPVTSRAVHLDVPVWSRLPLDLLFVIDDSPAMAPFQSNLAAGFATFASMLESAPGGVPDLHVGVITADPIDGGAMRSAPQVGGRFLTTAPLLDGSRAQNFSGTLRDALVTAANVGAHGAEITQPLAMLQRALDGNPSNAGFLRDTAYLAVVVITAGEDRSAGSVAGYAAFLQQRKTDRTKVLVSAAFNPEPSSQACAAEAAPRLAELLGYFPDRSSSASLCSTDLAPLLSGLEDHADQVPLGLSCSDAALVEVDPARGGTPYECTAELRSMADRWLVPACERDARLPCWQIDLDRAGCPQANHERFELVRVGLALPAPTSLVADCLAE